jgi:LytS/YehU family sensor histidine kinase
VLIPKDPQAARRMVRHLSEFLRQTLQNDAAQVVPLETELDFLERYLQIERARFGDRLVIERNIASETLHAAVPNLILQPLVENAVRHGLAEQRAPALIAISASRDNGTLRLQVQDNGRGLETTGPERRDGPGIGLANTRARLQRLYGDRYRFELRHAAERGVVVTLEIPFQGMQKDQ